MNRTGLRILAGAVALVAAACVPAMAGADCFYDDLSAGSTYALSNSNTARLAQNYAYWTAMAVGPVAPDDWDLSVYSSAAAAPGCATGLLASSAAGGSVVDFVMGDFNGSGNAFGTYYAKVNRFSGTELTAWFQWDSGSDALVVNDLPITRAVTNLNLIECWDVYLEAGRTYKFDLAHPGSAALKVMLFRNPADAPYWAGRSSRVLETATTANYVAPASDWYGVVVVNDNAGSDTYRLAIGSCDPPTPLASGIVSGAAGVSAWRSFAQVNPYFTAVAARSVDPAQDWDLELYTAASGGAYPACFSSYMTGSSLGSGQADFVVGDFNVGANPQGTYYARAYPFGAATSPGVIEWDAGNDQIIVDAAPITRVTGGSDVIECWDVFLNGGQNFGINFTHDGAADVKVMIFRNPGAAYWTPRSGANLTSSGNATYLAPASDWYSVIVVNDNGAAGTYKLGISQCAGLYSLPSMQTLFSTPYLYAEIHPTEAAWTVFGALNSPDETAGNWDAQIFRDGTGGVFPACPSTLIAQSTLPTGVVDFVAGDFHVNPPGYYYPFTLQRPGASNNVKLCWDGGAEVITVNDPPVDRSGFFVTLLESWDVFLTAGQAYTFKFNVASGSGLRLALMRNPGASPYWAGRAAAEFDVPGGDHPYIAPATGWYGAVVVNDKINEPGAFTLGVYTGAVAVESGAGFSTRFASAIPNPTRSGVTFGYELREPAAVDFEVRDVAGRLVAQVPAGRHEAGRGSLVWDGLTSGGSRVAAGIYFVKMKVAGHTTGNTTVVML